MDEAKLREKLSLIEALFAGHLHEPVRQARRRGAPDGDMAA
jgi:hypothetical protein